VNIPVIYEDNWLLVLDKPSGLLTIPTPKKELRTLTSILNDELKERGISGRVYPCHRLDRDTSGLIIYSKGKSMQEKMAQEFREKKIKKTYIAFVQGAPKQAKGTISYPIEGRPAITNYRVLEQRKDFSIVEVTPSTGRTNQIRIHLKQIGHPLVGESKFAFRRDFQLKAKRSCLHANELEFIHPMTNKAISFTAPLPADMQNFLNKH
jgi:23S rRNA pseudouridine1911/1915/1917 synthase